MSKEKKLVLTPEEKTMLRERLDVAGSGVERHIAEMVTTLGLAGDHSNGLKLKQALLSFRVVYNRARLKLRS